jgi:membrane protein required for colicin V production
MTFLDYLVLIVVAVSVASGAAKGILKGSISLISALVGLVAAAYSYRFVSRFSSLFVSSVRLAELVAFAAVFVAIVAAGAVFSYKLRRWIKGSSLSMADHFLGAAFGLLRAWLVCSVLYLALTAFPVRIQAVVQSRFAPLLLEGTRIISFLTSTEIRDRFLSGYARVEELWKEETTR